MIVSERIFDVMNRRGLSQKEFSIQTGIPQSTISDWKNKGTNPASDKIMIICEVLEMSPVELLTGSESSGEAEMQYIAIDKGTEEYFLVEKYRQMDTQLRQRLLGYADALVEM